MAWSRGRDAYLHMFYTRGVFYSTHKVPVPVCVCVCVRVWPCCIVDTWLRMPDMSAGAPARAFACVRVWYSFQILSKAWFPQGNDRGHLIGEGWKQHLHPIGHTHNIKVLARQKHVKEIYIAVLTAPHTQGHRPLPLTIIKVTVRLLSVNSTFPITNKNITERFFFPSLSLALSPSSSVLRVSSCQSELESGLADVRWFSWLSPCARI